MKNKATLGNVALVTGTTLLLTGLTAACSQSKDSQIMSAVSKFFKTHQSQVTNSVHVTFHSDNVHSANRKFAGVVSGLTVKQSKHDPAMQELVKAGWLSTTHVKGWRNSVSGGYQVVTSPEAKKTLVTQATRTLKKHFGNKTKIAVGFTINNPRYIPDPSSNGSPGQDHGPKNLLTFHIHGRHWESNKNALKALTKAGYLKTRQVTGYGVSYSDALYGKRTSQQEHRYKATFYLVTKKGHGLLKDQDRYSRTMKLPLVQVGFKKVRWITPDNNEFHVVFQRNYHYTKYASLPFAKPIIKKDLKGKSLPKPQLREITLNNKLTEPANSLFDNWGSKKVKPNATAPKKKPVTLVLYRMTPKGAGQLGASYNVNFSTLKPIKVVNRTKQPNSDGNITAEIKLRVVYLHNKALSNALIKLSGSSMAKNGATHTVKMQVTPMQHGYEVVNAF